MTEPYYQDESVTLYHGDCLHNDTWTTADVLVTDPPYGMKYVSGFRPTHDPIAGDEDPQLRDAVLGMWSGPALVFGTWRVAPPANERQRLIWWKQGNGYMGNLDLPWGTGHEDIYVLGGGWSTPDHLRRTTSVIVSTTPMGGQAGVIGQSGHPTAKPVPLLESLIERCPPGVIADPFAGAGSTLIAARNLGRHAIGVELEERYCETIARRIAQGAFDLGGTA